MFIKTVKAIRDFGTENTWKVLNNYYIWIINQLNKYLIFCWGVCFIRFPNVFTNRQRCEKWVKACDRKEFTIDCVNENTYICGKHFIGGNGPTKTCADPLPPNLVFFIKQFNIFNEFNLYFCFYSFWNSIKRSIIPNKQTFVQKKTKFLI